MFEIWETSGPPGLLAEAATLDEALERLNTECERRHDQAAAGAAGAQELRHEFEIRDQAGKMLAVLVFHPDTTRPYESVLVDELGSEWS
ncbi:MAG: hypothetical protein QOE54_6591 [Streptosporangiaceae bacterium]|jgi:hypothetical protein|nr:hypothetical protein [Streptosporangiaceae bacterium]MDX6434225.1 hypothetical protein [Streptosporangiaceae bacterium]